jgi:hypothetical protein
MSCFECPVPNVLSEWSYPRCPLSTARVVPSRLSYPGWLSCPSCPVLAVIFWPFCFVSSLYSTIPSVFSDFPVPAFLFWLSCPSCLVPAVLPQLSYTSCPIPAVLSSLSCPGLPRMTCPRCPMSTDLPWLSHPLSCPSCPVLVVLSCPVLAVLSLLSCLVPAVLSW